MEIHGIHLFYTPIRRAAFRLAAWDSNKDRTACYVDDDPEHMDHAYAPSFDWTVAGPIIERERIAVMPRDDGAPWRAVLWLPPDASVAVYGTGPAPLIAAMRAYVASKFGEEVELP